MGALVLMLLSLPTLAAAQTTSPLPTTPSPTATATSSSAGSDVVLLAVTRGLDLGRQQLDTVSSLWAALLATTTIGSALLGFLVGLRVSRSNRSTDQAERALNDLRGDVRDLRDQVEAISRAALTISSLQAGQEDVIEAQRTLLNKLLAAPIAGSEPASANPKPGSK